VFEDRDFLGQFFLDMFRHTSESMFSGHWPPPEGIQ